MRPLLYFFLLLLSLNLAGQTDAERGEIIGAAMQLDTRGEPEAAREMLLPLLRDAAGQAYTDSLGAAANFAIGRTYLEQQDRPLGIPYFERAIELAQANFPNAHNLLGQYYVRLSEATIVTDLDTTITLCEAALPYFQKATDPDTIFMTRAYWNMARAYELKGDLVAATSSINLAMSLMEQSPTVSENDRFLIYYQATQIMSALDGDNPRLLLVARKAMASSKASGRPYFQTFGYNALAAAQRLRQDFEGVDSTLRAMLSFLATAPGLEYARGDALVALAVNDRELNRFEDAVDHAREAVRVYERYDPDYLPDALTSLARALTQVGDYREALATFDKSLSKRFGSRTVDRDGQRFADRALLDSMNLTVSAVKFYGARARTYRAMDEPQLALANLQESIQILENQRANTQLAESRKRQSDRLSFYYGEAITTSQNSPTTDGHKNWDALLYSEKARGYSILSDLSNRRTLRPEREQELRAEITELEQDVSGDQTVANRLATLRLELNRLLRDGAAPLPEPVELTTDKLRGYLDSGERDVLQYFLGQEDSYVFHYHPGEELQVYQITSPDSLADRITRWRDAIIAGAYRRKRLQEGKEQTRLDQVVAELGFDLLQQIMPDVDVANLGEDLLIIPDGVLNYLPFDALPVRITSSVDDYRVNAYLGEGRAINYAYSLRHLAELDALGQEGGQQRLVAFAPRFAGEATAMRVGEARGEVRSGRRPLAQGLPALAPLAHNVAEVNAIAGLIGNTKTYKEERATYANFLSEMDGAGILHVASHGLVNAADPNLSFLAFAGEGGREESLLFFNELANLQTDADLVVLSACETSIGRVVPGESVQSFASAFTSAGAKSTLTSLWQVDDAATRELMEAFYKSLSKGNSRSVALAEAKEELRGGEEFAHPYYWSGFVLNGQSGPLELAGAGTPLWVWLGAGSLILLLILFLFLRRSRA